VGLEAREVELALCELLAALWQDEGWRRAWAAAGEAVVGRCPLRRLLAEARLPLAYGDPGSNRKYFRNFGRLAVQATMLQDETRTGSYHRAILRNRADFEGKVVMDVGSGTGMLAFFAIQAGAAKVYCVEASPMAEVISELAAANGWAGRVVVVNRVLQEIRDEVPERVDCITHETLGNFLFAERGIETVLVARQRFLKPGGRLFPAAATFCVAPFEDGRAYQARVVKASNLWSCRDFYGVDLSPVEPRARREMFARPLSDQFHPDQLRADAQTQVFDFRTLQPEQVLDFALPLAFTARATCVLHGLAGWFEVHFEGSTCDVLLSTSPWDTLTHWWMTRLMLPEPLAVNEGQRIGGSLDFAACEGNTYRCRLLLEAGGVCREASGMDLAEGDVAHRAPQHRTQQLGPHARVQLVDWPATRASPTAPEALVEDPLRGAKLAAAQSEAAAGAATRAGGAMPGREYGAQLRVGGRPFMLVDAPELCKQLTAPASALVLVGSLGGTLLLEPQQAPGSCLVELSTQGAVVQPRCWLPLEGALEHMRCFLLEHQPANSPEALGEEQIKAMSQQRLAGTYSMMKRARAAFQARARGGLPGRA